MLVKYIRDMVECEERKEKCRIKKTIQDILENNNLHFVRNKKLYSLLQTFTVHLITGTLNLILWQLWFEFLGNDNCISI